MNPNEYLAFIPLLLYGISLADLLGQWRRFFNKEYLYWPYFLTTLIFTETAIYNVFIYLEITGDMENISYSRYWIFLIQPILFLLIVHALTPEQNNKDTEGYFKKRIPIVFGLMAVYIAWHLLPGFSTGESLDYPRFIGIALCIAVAVSRKISLVYLMGAVWLLSLFMR